MDKKFLLFGTSQDWNAVADKSAYVNSFIFLTDTKQLVVRGEAIGLSPEDSAALTKVIADEAALEKKVDGLKYFNGITNGVKSANCEQVANLQIKGLGDVVVNVTTEGFEVSLSVAEGTTNGTIAVNGTDVAVHGLGTAAYKANTYFATAFGVTELTDRVTINESHITAINTAIDTINGNIDAIEIPVDGVAENDKVISLTDGKLSSTLSVAYDSTTRKVQLKGIDGEVISDFDANAFIKDGMVNNARLYMEAETDVEEVPELPYIKLTFNADGGNGVVRFSVKDLVDVYNGDNLEVKDSEGNDKVLNTVLEEIRDSIAAVKGTSDDAVQAVDGGTADYITLTTEKTGTTVAVTPELTVQAVADASASAKGLAEASDVKAYVEAMLTWEEL